MSERGREREGEAERPKYDHVDLDAIVAEVISRELLKPGRFQEGLRRETVLGSLYRMIRDGLIRDIEGVIGEIMREYIGKVSPETAWAASLKSELKKEKEEREKKEEAMLNRLNEIERQLSETINTLKGLIEEVGKLRVAIETGEKKKEEKKRYLGPPEEEHIEEDNTEEENPEFAPPEM
ncbi:hypothetical protein [Candidatus Methanodesulfokora washburnensis]|uniref:Uncharacterized protein n=1 Tax=Candidatus Methanodesulfokora washburnensis TaxID=2478471 RepID=A0A3R9PEU0_9CREN|nr:hypothetical protein [Candidatus Methanodesulfokores washburnensis]RSN72472.1 hypothetical protein D6D85_13760 [Candidatus Methanodesulfokores washburnensis]